ncbi:MAG: hypothetical protein L6Q98_12195 [Anaerolineae bacterium]|nr:hypothetical protein [Anaerolineae bacterium]NUQ06401.1 hypothetical protein [Anaerolineae bacterium]
MPVINRWYYEKRVIHVVYYGQVSKADLEESREAMDQLIAEGTPPMYLLIDSTRVTQRDLGLKEMVGFFKPHALAIVGWTLVIGADPIARMLASAILQLMKGRFRFMKDLTEAVNFLRDMDESLKALPVYEYDPESGAP